jgi:diadenosine tetraphosphate (Ap4A) HIT family hydrolase
MSPMTNLPEPSNPLHPQLAKDCLELGRLDLCRLLLMNDANYPWFILVPDVPDVTEIFQLFQSDQEQLMRESSLVARMLVETFAADKVNIGALGNVVSQLHIHHIARYKNDPAWPAPVWGKSVARPYTEATLAAVRIKVSSVLGSALAVGTVA